MTNKLHVAIMNLPCNPPYEVGTNQIAYKTGHYDARNAAAELAATEVEAAPVGAVSMTAMVDAAMVEMANIYPPLRRSECERLIRAALAERGTVGEPAGEVKDRGDGTTWTQIFSDLPAGTKLYRHPAPQVAQVVAGGLADAAIAWWKHHRPTGWTEAQHIENPVVNCQSGPDEELADQVVAIIATKEPQA